MNLSPKLNILLLGLLTVMIVFSCVNPPDYPNEPVIQYIGVNKSSVYQGNGQLPDDTLEMYISFTDGDGDLSFEDSTDIFLYDSRFPSIVSDFSIPSIPEDGTGNGIRGEITIRTINRNMNICCLDNGIACPNLSEVSIDTDTFSYAIKIRDRSGNMSNSVQTEVLSILCR